MPWRHNGGWLIFWSKTLHGFCCEELDFFFEGICIVEGNRWIVLIAAPLLFGLQRAHLPGVAVLQWGQASASPTSRTSGQLHIGFISSPSPALFNPVCPVRCW